VKRSSRSLFVMATTLSHSGELSSSELLRKVSYTETSLVTQFATFERRQCCRVVS
jgi:hypothetical protein